jgi:uncharacterized spore protein YtfJ
MTDAQPEWAGREQTARADLLQHAKGVNMKVTEVLDTARDAMTIKRVFAEPYEKDGLTVIAAATVTGGAGGGSGTDPKGQQGEGAGFAANARPVGAYVIKNGQLSWRPAIDPNRIITMVGLIAIVYLLRRPRAKGRAPIRTDPR